MPLPKTQKVLHLLGKFGPFAVETIELVPPAADDVLVKVESTSLDPANWKATAWGIIADKFPYVLGFSASGPVVAVGANITRLKIGDRVCTESLPRFA